MRQVGQRMLEVLGYEVVLAADGREAVEAVRADREQPLQFALIDRLGDVVDEEVDEVALGLAAASSPAAAGTVQIPDNVGFLDRDEAARVGFL